MTRTPEIPVPTQRMVGQEVVVDALTGVVYISNHDSVEPNIQEDQQTNQSNQITGNDGMRLADYNL